jgi:hypothetical protein
MGLTVAYSIHRGVLWQRRGHEVGRIREDTAVAELNCRPGDACSFLIYKE